MSTINDYGSPTDSLNLPSHSAWAQSVATRANELRPAIHTYEWRAATVFTGTGSYTVIPGWETAVFNVPGPGTVRARLHGWLGCPGGSEITVYIWPDGAYVTDVSTLVYYTVLNGNVLDMTNSMTIESAAVCSAAGPVSFGISVRADAGIAYQLQYWCMFVEFSPYSLHTNVLLTTV